MLKGPRGEKRPGDLIGNAAHINHIHMVALYTVWYNWVRVNAAVRTAPAMAADISDRLWDIGDLVRIVDRYEASA